MSCSLKMVFTYNGTEKYRDIEKKLLKAFCFVALQSFDCDMFTLSDDFKIPIDDFLSDENTKYWYKQITFNRFTSQLIHVRNKDLFYFVLKTNEGVFHDCDMWVNVFSEYDEFVQAWLYDEEYDYWQNAEDLLQYKYANRSLDGLALVSNGLPYPLEQKIIDISMNFGRWSLENKYIKAIGAIMWFSDLFWAEVGFDKKSNTLKQTWLNSKIINARGIIKIRISDVLFFDSTTAEQQENLRKVLYGNSA